MFSGGGWRFSEFKASEARRPILHGTVSYAALTCVLIASAPAAGSAQEASDIADAVATNEAVLANGAMDAFLDYIAGNPVTGVGVGNMVLPADNPPAPLLIDGVTQSSNMDNTPAVDVGAAGEVRVLNGGDVSTTGLNAPGITVDPMGGALSVDITTGGQISTTGNGSAAIDTGAFDNSVFNLRVLGDGMSTAISTQGDNANAISLGDGTAGMSTATLGFQNTTLTTTGASSDIISAGANLSLPDAFSVSLGVENSTLTTQGDGSSVFSAVNQGASDVRLSFNEATLSTAGMGSDVISYLSDDADSINVTLINSSVDATGTNSRGLVFDQGSSSNATFFIGETDVRTTGSGLFFSTASQGGFSTLTLDQSSFDTTGGNASAIVFGQLTGVPSGTINSATLTDVSVTTQGANSEGVFMGAVGSGSARSFTASNLSVQTMGVGATALHIEDDSSAIGTASSADIQMSSFSTMADNARGVVFGGLGATGTQVLTLTTSTVSTLGNDAGALFTPGQTGDDSSFAFGVENSTLTTQGDRSIGLEVGSLQGSNSDATMVFDTLTVETAGTDSTGILIGSPDVGATNLLYNFTLQNSTVTTTGATSDALRHLPGTAGYNIRLDNTDLIASGAGSRGVVLGVGASSSAALFFSDVSIQSNGSSIFLESDGNGSALNLTLQESSFDTTGNSATAVVFGQVTGVPGGSVTSANLTSVDITTVGLNSEGILLGAVGDGSVSSFFVSDLTVETTGNGSTAVRVADDSASTGGTYASDFRSSTFSTEGNGAFGIIDGGRNANSVVSLGFDDITVTTMGDDAGAYFTPGASGAGSDFTLTGSNSTLTTQGDRSVGLEVANLGGTGSDVDIDILGTQITTAGEAAQGILIGSPEAGATNVTYALRLEDSAITTTGAMSDALSHAPSTATGGAYAVEIVGSDVMATGTGSRGLTLDVGSQVATTVFIDDSTFVTSGSSVLVQADVVSSTLNLTIDQSQFTTSENDASAIVFGQTTVVPNDSVISGIITNTDVATTGTNSEGIFIGALGNNSARTFTADTVTVMTQGDGATALHLADDTAAMNSIAAFAFQSSTFSTQGNNARGIIVGGLGADSGQIQDFDDIMVSTMGNDSGAYFTPGAMGANSNFALLGSNSTLTTQGDRSIGLEVGSLPGAGSEALLDFDNLTIETAGQDATGILIGSPDAGASDLVYQFMLDDSSIITTGAMSDAVLHMPGLGNYAVEIRNSDLTTTGANSLGFALESAAMSNTSVFIVGSQFNTTGSALSFDSTSDQSIMSFTIQGSQFDTSEDNASAIVIGRNTGTPTGTVSTTTITDSQVSTMGLNADGIFLGATGQSSSRAFVASNLTVETSGIGANALNIEDDSGTATDAIFATTILNSSFTTMANGAGGLILGGLGARSTQTLTLDDLQISTMGNDATAVFTPGQVGADGNFQLTFANSTLTTLGDRSVGLEVANTPGDGSETTVSVGSTTIDTSGSEAMGVVIGNAISDPNPTDRIFQVALNEVDVSTSGANATGLEVNGPGAGGSDLTQTFIFEDLDVNTTGANAHAIDLNFASSTGMDSSFQAMAQLSATATGAGSDALNVTGTGDLLPFMLTIEAGDALSSADGFALRETGMNTTMNVAGLIAGDMDFGTGDDAVTFMGNALDLQGLSMVDGGAGTDTASFDTATATFANDVAFVNFEGPVTAVNTDLTLQGVTLDLNSLEMTGMSRLNATGVSQVGASLQLNGALSQTNGLAGDVLTINGDLSGTFTYAFDTLFDVPEVTDLLMVAGDTTAATGTIAVTNLGGLGMDTGQDDGDGILIIDVAGMSEENDFALAGGGVQAGAFVYGLHRSSAGDFFLQTVPGISDAGHLYSKTPELVFSAHDALLDVPLNDDADDPFGGAPVLSFAAQPEPKMDVRPFVRAFGGFGSYNGTTVSGPIVETSETEFDFAGMQFGTSIGLPSRSGSMAVYVAGHAMTGSQDVDRTVTRTAPAGDIDTEGYGTLLGWSYTRPDMGYIRTTLAYTHADHDFVTGAGAVGSTSGDYVSLALEGGRHIPVSDTFTFTPWARLGYEYADIGGFTDSAGTVVSSFSTDQMIVTVGARGTWHQSTIRAQSEIFAGLALSHQTSPDTNFALMGFALNDNLDDETFAEFDAGVAWTSADGRLRSRFSVASRLGLASADTHRTSARFDVSFNF